MLPNVSFPGHNTDGFDQRRKLLFYSWMEYRPPRPISIFCPLCLWTRRHCGNGGQQTAPAVFSSP